MKNTIMYALIAVASICLSACSTNPVAKYNPDLSRDQGYATLYLYRGATKTKNAVTLRVNGENAGKLGSAKHVTVKLPAGKHTLSTRSRSFGDDATAIITTIQVDAKAGETLLMSYSENTHELQVGENYAFVKLNANLSLIDASTAQYSNWVARISDL